MVVGQRSQGRNGTTGQQNHKATSATRKSRPADKVGALSCFLLWQEEGALLVRADGKIFKLTARNSTISRDAPTRRTGTYL